ncbi:hypothetical protein [Tenacibaculum dicentrarchi]|uniref:hypothetical protein n=1 Tax=Tenacibaculum dicentrarchi TaxID=669041 RepID=UPI000C7CF935|nr:conserved hypothetical protein [Tenacibaculum dicentrarchi]
MKNIQFDTGLNGGLAGACPSKDIARRLEAQTRDALANKSEWKRKYESLKNGEQAKQWASLKIEITNQEKTIKAEQLKLKQEKEVADALGLNGWFSNIGKSLCKKSIKRREHAENSLKDAENHLGRITGSYNTLDRQQNEGIRRAGEVVLKNKATIAQLKKEIQAVKTKIAKYKAERDSIKKAEAQAQAQAQASVTAPKVNSAGILSKKNLPIIAGALFLGGVLYFSKNGKKTTTIKRKKVTKKVSA